VRGGRRRSTSGKACSAVERLDERGISHSGVKDRGFIDSIYFEDPLGLLIELASYRFEPPFGRC
jgi:catechol-2,3-dioxygenase